MNEPNPDVSSGGEGATTASRGGNPSASSPGRVPSSDKPDSPGSDAPSKPSPAAEGKPTSDKGNAAQAGETSPDGAQSDGPKSETARSGGTASSSGSRNRRRRRGGRGRGGSGSGSGGQSGSGDSPGKDGSGATDARNPDELPKPSRQGRPSATDAEKSLVRTPSGEGGGKSGSDKGGDAAGKDASKDGDGPSSGDRPRVGDSRPAPGSDRPKIGDSRPAPATSTEDNRRDKGGGQGKGGGRSGGRNNDRNGGKDTSDQDANSDKPARKRRRRGGRGRGSGRGPAKVAQGRAPEGVRSGVAKPVTAMTGGTAIELDEETLEERRGKTRNGKPVGRYLMAVHKQAEATHIAILEGRSLVEHHVAHPADDINQIHGNVYLGRVQNVLPGMEAAFIDIGTPKNAVLYRGDLHFDPEDIEELDKRRIEQLLQPRQTVLCQVTKNPIMHKGARLTQEVSLPGRFVVLVPNSRTVGISKRLSDAERKRLRKIVDKNRPEGHGVIVRTAAEDITGPEIERDLARLVAQWEKIEALANKASAPALLYREPDMALRVIREEFNRDFRSVLIDDKDIFDDIHDYVASVSPALAERVEFYDPAERKLPLLEQHRVIEQLHRALDRKVWLPSGGSLIIEHTEALTVIDVNTGKNVGKSSLEETVFDNNLEAAVEIARQLRLRDVGGIIVIDFVDMEVKKNRAEVVRVFREALARDKTRTQVFDISELGLVQMTRKRIGEGLLESFSSPCETCEGRGVTFDKTLFQT